VACSAACITPAQANAATAASVDVLNLEMLILDFLSFTSLSDGAHGSPSVQLNDEETLLQACQENLKKR
jgi:hypothetical protein